MLWKSGGHILNSVVVVYSIILIIYVIENKSIIYRLEANLLESKLLPDQGGSLNGSVQAFAFR